MSDWYVNVNTHRCFIMSMMYVRNLVDLHLKYYTDGHNVDEDLMAIASCGGNWNYRTGTGVMNCDLSNSPNELNHTDVAYKYNKNSTPVMRVEF